MISELNVKVRKYLRTRDVPWIFIVITCVDGNDRLGRDTTLADRADQRVPRLLHPHVDARPAVQVPALSYYRLFCSVQADIALED